MESNNHFTDMNDYKRCKAVENQTRSFLKANACSSKQYSKSPPVCRTALSLDHYIPRTLGIQFIILLMKSLLGYLQYLETEYSCLNLRPLH